jgi:prepilin-type N-terminal cleavage/methylation domain-containing protein
MRRGRRGSGFTLIEIVAAVAIFALLVGLIAPRVGSLTSRTLQQRAERIAARLELARQRSVLTGVPHRLLVDLDEGGYRVEWEVTEAEAEGREPEPPVPLDLRGQTPIPMAPVRGEERSYRPLPGQLGDFEWLEDDLVFAGLETPEGWIDRGEASIEFERDGTASYTALYLDDESGRSLVLDVLPLADAVRISDAKS